MIECSRSACECQSEAETPVTTKHITDEFIQQREWFIKVFWEGHILPAMMLMTEQLSTVAMQQAMIIGSLFDAKHQMESQRLLQQLMAEAHKDYQPSQGMCEFGTNTRSLAASDRNSDLSKVAIASRSLQLQLLSGDSLSAGGSRDLSRSRLDRFRNIYCNKQDFGNGMTRLCQNTSPERMNRDINFTNIIDLEETLEIDFSEPAATADEEDVLALSNNLYGHHIFPRIPEDKMATANGRVIPKGTYPYMNMRALQAKRSVAQAAYAAQTAMKSQGTENVEPYMRAILEDMGIRPADVTDMLGPRPSYSAQMKFLAKKLYQTPDFYADLYDKPVNIDRKMVSMEAIGLMQRRDMYRSQLRAEAINAVWLESFMKDLEEDYENDLRPYSSDNPVLDIPALN